jgi:hypothetical protein
MGAFGVTDGCWGKTAAGCHRPNAASARQRLAAAAASVPLRLLPLWFLTPDKHPLARSRSRSCSRPSPVTLRPLGVRLVQSCRECI